jgi:hypothetical protein
VELPVHTGLLRMERRIYQLGELELPRPVSLPEAIGFATGLATMVAVTRLLHLSVSAGWAWLYLVLPWAVAWAASRPIADRKRAHIWALTQLKHVLTEPRVLVRLRRRHEPSQLLIAVQVWQPRSGVDTDMEPRP